MRTNTLLGKSSFHGRSLAEQLAPHASANFASAILQSVRLLEDVPIIVYAIRFDGDGGAVLAQTGFNWAGRLEWFSFTERMRAHVLGSVIHGKGKYEGNYRSGTLFRSNTTN